MKRVLLAFVLIATVIFTNSFAFADVTKGSKADTPKFSDIDKHWAKESINKVVDKDVFADKDGKFMPNKAITRSEFVLMLHEALDIQIAYFKAPDIKEHFEDVKNEDAYASALYDLVTLNIIDIKGQFEPDSRLTREEMVHFIMNAYRYEMGDKYKMIKIAPNPFADDKKINPSYSGDIARAEYMGIIKRPVSNHFYPKQNSTRAEAATVIDRLLIQLEKENPQVQVTPSAAQKDGALTAKLTIVNNTEKQITINHSSGQKFDFKLLDSNKKVLYTWSSDKSFIMMLTETVIEPGKSIEFSETFDKAFLDSLSGKPAYVKAYITGESDDFTINPDGYEIVVK
ncbi:MAG: putative S-layer protein [Clostridia bacterium]|jgi:hypothetical protein|nr:putative S-layer protein [Clostridia bacterium]